MNPLAHTRVYSAIELLGLYADIHDRTAAHDQLDAELRNRFGIEVLEVMRTALDAWYVHAELNGIDPDPWDERARGAVWMGMVCYLAALLCAEDSA